MIILNENGEKREALYVYKVIRESFNGEQCKRSKKYYSNEPLHIGGLYVHLGTGFPGMQRVLEFVGFYELP